MQGDDGAVYGLGCYCFEGFQATPDYVDGAGAVEVEGFGYVEAEAAAAAGDYGDYAFDAEEVVDIEVGHFGVVCLLVFEMLCLLLYVGVVESEPRSNFICDFEKSGIVLFDEM